MVGAIVVGVVIGGLATLVVRVHSARVETREARSRERLAAIVLFEEITAAIDAIDMALKEGSSKWLVSVSESATLTESWREHGDAMRDLDAERWYVLNEAVSTLTPGHELVPANARSEDLRRSLVKRRELLAESADIVRGVRDRRTRNLSGQPRRVRSLLV